jgi:hypothetical protein
MVDKDNKGIEVYLFDYGNYNMSYLKLSGNCYMLMLNRNQHERRWNIKYRILTLVGWNKLIMTYKALDKLITTMQNNHQEAWN